MSVAVEEMAGAMQGRVTGVIIPPPDIRAVADKTAQFVARNGKNFEQKILGSADGKTPKFNFMKVMDPYHAYYEMKIKEFEEGVVATPKPAPAAPEPKEVVAPVTATVSKASVQNPLSKFAMNKPSEPPADFQFIMNHPSGISSVDVDVIKLTARYTAINGREFLSGLAQREQRNPQFDFLKPTHMLFSYFTTFVDAYAKIIVPSNDLLKKVRQNTDRMCVLEQGVQRWEWIRQEEERKKKEESEADADRSANQAIDWYDFQIVETIEFGENDLLDMVNMAALNPYADRPEEVNGGGEMDVDDSVPPPPPPPPMSNQVELDMDMDMDDIKVVSDYTPRMAGNKNKAATMIDPISGKAVPLADVGEHMRVQLMDPKWRIEQQRFLNKQKETGFAEGSSIADSLKNFARQRGDIFSTADQDEASFLEEQKKKHRRVEETNQVIWDGHQSSLPQVQQQKSDIAARQPAPPPSVPTGVAIGPSGPLPGAPYGAPAPPPAMYGGMAPPPPPQPMMGAPPQPPMPGMPPGPPPGMPYMPPGYMGGPHPPPPSGYDFPPPSGYDFPAPAPAEEKTVLVPEQEFASRYPRPITVNVHVPALDQVIPILIPVTSTIKDLKEMLIEKTSTPANKQQIKYKGTFLKDPQSFAAVNIGPGGAVEMIGRSRGGKR